MEENNSKELSLIQLLNVLIEWVVKVTKKLFRFIGHLMQLAIKYWPVSLVILIFSLIAGQYLARPSARKYRADGMA